MRSTCEQRMRLWTLSSCPAYNITTSKQANCATQTRVSATIPTINPIQALPDWNLVHFVQIVYQSHAEVFHTTSACARKHNHFEGAREVIGDVAGYEDEHCNRCVDPWAPFNSAEGFKLPSWFIDGNISKTQMKDYFSRGLGNAESVGYSSMPTRENHLPSAKNILPHVLHTYLPVSPGNTISPYTPHASHFSVLF